jgi:hypothetical protein
MITLQQVKDALIAEKYFVPEADIETAFNTIDQQALYNTIRSALTVVEWDLVSPINGAEASAILANIQLPSGSKPYLINRSGQTMYFQWHKANVEGYQAVVDPIAEGNAHADEIATQNVVSGVVSMIKEGLKPNQVGYEEATKKQAQDALVLELIEGGII